MLFQHKRHGILRYLVEYATLPVLAAVNPAGEVARIVRESGGGWVVDSSDAEAFPRELARLGQEGGEIRERGGAARRYAEEHFAQSAFAQRFERVLQAVADGRRGRRVT